MQFLVDHRNQAGDRKGQRVLPLVGSQDDREHTQQGDEAAREGVDEELGSRVASLRTSPDANQKEERD
jgi:hypothetical protein